jgi:hypothetical protein
MSISREQLEKIFKVLVDHCTTGYLHFRMWRRINKAAREMPRKLEQFKGFLLTTREAHELASVIHLARLLDRSSQLVSIHRLLNVAQSNAHLFKYTNRDQLMNALKNHQASLDGPLKGLLENIKAHRSLYLAHLDEGILRRPLSEIMDDYPVTRTDIDQLYKDVIDIVSTYYQFYYNSERIMDWVIGEDDIDWLFSFIDENTT